MSRRVYPPLLLRCTAVLRLGRQHLKAVPCGRESLTHGPGLCVSCVGGRRWVGAVVVAVPMDRETLGGQGAGGVRLLAPIRRSAGDHAVRTAAAAPPAADRMGPTGCAALGNTRSPRRAGVLGVGGAFGALFEVKKHRTTTWTVQWPVRYLGTQFYGTSGAVVGGRRVSGAPVPLLPILWGLCCGIEQIVPTLYRGTWGTVCKVRHFHVCFLSCHQILVCSHLRTSSLPFFCATGSLPQPHQRPSPSPPPLALTDKSARAANTNLRPSGAAPPPPAAPSRDTRTAADDTDSSPRPQSPLCRAAPAPTASGCSHRTAAAPAGARRRGGGGAGPRSLPRALRQSPHPLAVCRGLYRLLRTLNHLNGPAWAHCHTPHAPFGDTKARDRGPGHCLVTPGGGGGLTSPGRPTRSPTSEKFSTPKK